MKTNRMNRVLRAREMVGAEVRRLRKEAELTLEELDEATGVGYSLISAIEHGNRAVAADVATRMANAFKLKGRERDQFLITAASTRSRDKLVGYARRLDPEIVNFLPKVLQEKGLDLDEVRHCQFQPTVFDPLLGGRYDEPEEWLTLKLNDGRRIGCAVVTVELKGAGRLNQGS